MKSINNNVDKQNMMMIVQKIAISSVISKRDYYRKNEKENKEGNVIEVIIIEIFDKIYCVDG